MSVTALVSSRWSATWPSTARDSIDCNISEVEPPLPPLAGGSAAGCGLDIGAPCPGATGTTCSSIAAVHAGSSAGADVLRGQVVAGVAVTGVKRRRSGPAEQRLEPPVDRIERRPDHGLPG